MGERFFAKNVTTRFHRINCGLLMESIWSAYRHSVQRFDPKHLLPVRIRVRNVEPILVSAHTRLGNIRHRDQFNIFALTKVAQMHTRNSPCSNKSIAQFLLLTFGQRPYLSPKNPLKPTTVD